MTQVSVTLDCGLIHDFPSMHSLFAEKFGFAKYYGRNMDAWIDTMSSLDNADSAQSDLSLLGDDTLLLVLDRASDCKQRCPAIIDALVEGSAVVNQRCRNHRNVPMIALVFTDPPLP